MKNRFNSLLKKIKEEKTFNTVQKSNMNEALSSLDKKNDNKNDNIER